MSPESLCQSLTNIDVDACSQPSTRHRDPSGRVRGRTEGDEGVCNPIGRTTVINQPDPQSSQGLTHKPKEYTWRDPWLQQHM